MMLLHSLRQPLLHSLCTLAPLAPRWCTVCSARNGITHDLYCSTATAASATGSGTTLWRCFHGTRPAKLMSWQFRAHCHCRCCVPSWTTNHERLLGILFVNFSSTTPINVQDTRMAISVTHKKHHMNSRNPCNGDAHRIQLSAGLVTASVIKPSMCEAYIAASAVR